MATVNETKPTQTGGDNQPPKRKLNPLVLAGGAVVGVIVVVALIVLVILPFSGITRETRNESSPFAAAQPTNSAMAKPTGDAMAKPTGDAMSKPGDAMQPKPTADAMSKPGDAMQAKPTADAVSKPGDAMQPKPTADAMVKPTADAMSKPGDAMASKATVIGQGQFNKIDEIHKASGTAILGTRADGKKVVRFENFTVGQGPDLKVYLVGNADGSNLKGNGVNLGALPATDGNYNVNIPDSVDITKYKSVVIWCEAFSVTFSVASLK